MNPIPLFFVLLLTVTFSVFADDLSGAWTPSSSRVFTLSTGLGADFAASFDSYRYDGGDGGLLRTLGGGVYAFFDATYAEAGIGFLFGAMKHKAHGLWSEGTYDLSYMTFALYGKYPFNLRYFHLFPMLGVQFDLGLGATNNGADVFSTSQDKAGFMNRIWIKFGAGADINLTEHLYLRPSFLYGINFGTKEEWGLKSAIGYLDSFNHGLDVRIAVGYRFGAIHL